MSKTYNTSELNSMKVLELQDVARKMGIKNVKGYKKAELIKVIYETQLQKAESAPKAEAKPKPKKESTKKKSAPKKEEKKPKATKSEEAKSDKVTFHRGNNRQRNRMTFR